MNEAILAMKKQSRMKHTIRNKAFLEGKIDNDSKKDDMKKLINNIKQSIEVGQTIYLDSTLNTR